MRVAFVTVDTPHTADTARTRRLDRLARHLAANGAHVEVCCTQWWGGDVPTFDQDGVTYRRVTADRSPGRFAARLPVVLRRTAPDLVHASYWPTAAAVSTGVHRWLLRAPVVVDWYGDRPVDGTRRRTRMGARLPTRVLTPSRHVKTRVLELGGIPDRIQVVPEGIDVSLVREQEPADGPDIVTARRLDDEANVDMMLLGLAELRDRDWTAAVIGDGPARDRYERKAVELRIEDRVSFLGAISREERIARYKAAHVFVQTAERCPFAVELLWALASGCVGIVDYQEDSAAHELVEALDRGFRTTGSEELSEAILEAAELPRLSFDDTFAGYDRSRIYEQHMDLYDALLR